MKTIAKHPYEHTLGLLRLAIERLSPVFPVERRRDYEGRLQRYLAEPATDYEEIRQTIVSLGKESWSSRKAYDELYARYGRSSEEAHLLGQLDAGIREKYERYIEAGGKIGYVERVKSEAELLAPSPFERFFSPEEKFAIQQSLVEAREAARKEIDALVSGPKRLEYEEAIAAFEDERHDIEKKLEELRNLASVSRKWRSEIIDKARSLEEGWSVVEPDVSKEKVTAEVEYWKGTLESFLSRI